MEGTEFKVEVPKEMVSVEVVNKRLRDLGTIAAVTSFMIEEALDFLYDKRCGKAKAEHDEILEKIRPNLNMWNVFKADDFEININHRSLSKAEAFSERYPDLRLRSEICIMGANLLCEIFNPIRKDIFDIQSNNWVISELAEQMEDKWQNIIGDFFYEYD